MQFMTSWERKGRAEEALAPRRSTLLELLQEKFGAIPETAVQKVEEIASVEDLCRLLRQLIHAKSLAEMGLDGTRE